MTLREVDKERLTLQSAHRVNGHSAYWSDWTTAADRLWSQRRAIFAWAGAGLIVSLGLAFWLPKYHSTVQVMPPDSSSNSLSALALPALTKMPGLAGLASEFIGSKSTGAVFVKVLESRTVQDDLINRFDLRKRYGFTYWEDTRKRLHWRTSIKEDKKSGVITLTVTDRDPKLAEALAGAYVEELDRVVARVSTSAARRERIFIEQRLTEEKQTLEDAETQFSRFASSTMALDVPEQTKVTVEAAARLQGELIASRAELDSLQQIYTAENYRVKALRARVAELEREARKMNSGPLATGSAQDPTNPFPSVKSLPLLGVQWVGLYRATKIHETVFELLTQQYEMAKIQEAKEIPTVRLLDSASNPEKRYPRPLTVVILGVLTFIVLGSVSTWLKDYWDAWSVEDPRRAFLLRVYLGVRGSAQTAIARVGKLGASNANGAAPEQPEQVAPVAPVEKDQEEYSDRSA